MGINVETIKRGEHVDIYSSTRELTEEERKMVREDMEGIYRAFLERVSEGRKMPIEDVDRIGRGRIYTGSMAKRLGLVDDLGGMEKAVEMARDLAKIPKGKEHILVEISGKRLPIPELGAIFLSLLSSLNRF
jgi:protease-4